MFAVTGRYTPPPPGLGSPWRWGTADGAAELIGGGADVTVTPRSFLQRFPSPEAMIALFRESFGPTSLTYEAVGPGREAELTEALIAVVERFDRATDGTSAMQGDYAEVVAIRR